MSHEINDKAVVHENNESKIMFISVHDHNSEKTIAGGDDMHKMLEHNEAEIAAARERVADIARRVAGLKSSCEPGHFEAMKDCISRGAAANEPAYVEMAKHIGC
jgi:hypothetical protein